MSGEEIFQKSTKELEEQLIKWTYDVEELSRFYYEESNEVPSYVHPKPKPSLKTLRVVAKEYGISGFYEMNEDELIKKLKWLPDKQKRLYDLWGRGIAYEVDGYREETKILKTRELLETLIRMHLYYKYVC